MREYIRHLRVLSVLTILLWNSESLLSFLDSIMGSNIHGSIFDVGFMFLVWLIIAFILILPMPIVVLTYSIYHLKTYHDVIVTYQKNWFRTIIAFNILFLVMLGGSFFFRLQFPDVGMIIRNIRISAMKSNVAEDVLSYLEETYGDEFSFSIHSSRNLASGLFPTNRRIWFGVYENNYNFYFGIVYDIDLSSIYINHFERDLVHQKVNLRMIEYIDDIIGEGLTLHVRWDWLNRMQNIPIYATADDIIAGRYGRLLFNATIFILVDDISLDDAKQMYLSILRYFCFVHMTPNNESRTSQMQLRDANFSLRFVSTAQYNSVWYNTTTPGSGEPMLASYASISAGRVGWLAEGHPAVLNFDVIYEAARRTLSERYTEASWHRQL